MVTLLSFPNKPLGHGGASWLPALCYEKLMAGLMDKSKSDIHNHFTSLPQNLRLTSACQSIRHCIELSVLVEGTDSYMLVSLDQTLNLISRVDQYDSDSGTKN